MPLLLVALVLVLTGAPSPVRAAAELHLETHLQALSGVGWQAREIHLTVSPKSDNGPVQLQVSVASLKVPAVMPALRGIELHCTRFSLTFEEIHCRQGEFRATLEKDLVSTKVSFRYQQTQQRLEFTLTDWQIAGSRIDANGQIQQGNWQLRIDAADLDAPRLSGLLKKVPFWNGDLTAKQGRLILHATLSGQNTILKQADWSLTSRDLDLSAAGGSYAVQALDGRWQGQWQNGQLQTDLTFSRGQAYIQPLFLERSESAEPIELHLAGGIKENLLQLDTLTVNHPGVLRAEGSMVFALSGDNLVRRGDITVVEAFFPAAYSSYIQPFAGTLNQLETQGRVQGRVVFSPDALEELTLNLIDIQLQDPQGRFAINGLSGRLAWGGDSQPQRSSLYWLGGSLYQLKLDAGGLALMSEDDTFELVGEGRIPILDGTIVIEKLQGQGLGTQDFRWHFGGRLTPISMERLSEAFGWPPLSGKLSGTIPDVRYADHRLQVEGRLSIRVFEGVITVTHMELEEPLGTTPRVSADVDVQDLDLLTLTRTFDFGRIEGKLGGEIKNLRLRNWQPVRFDAFLATPQDDQSSHIISQRAVENISALGGGGVSVALSKGFLDLFETFNYDRLGFQCRLVDGVCEMGGVAPANGGYYLVRGEGLPRIDVIGYNRRVDWDVLLARLAAAIKATQSEDIVVQ